MQKKNVQSKAYVQLMGEYLDVNIHGCKLIGAGGGGFFLVVTNKKKDLLKKLKFLKISHIDFLIEKNGSIIIKN